MVIILAALIPCSANF